MDGEQRRENKDVCGTQERHSRLGVVSEDELPGTVWPPGTPLPSCHLCYWAAAEPSPATRDGPVEGPATPSQATDTDPVPAPAPLTASLPVLWTASAPASPSAQPATLNLRINIINARWRCNAFFLTLQNHKETRQDAFLRASPSSEKACIRALPAAVLIIMPSVKESSPRAPRTIGESQLHLKGNRGAEWELEPAYPVS